MARTHFNQLTPTELELLSLLAEECGELVQAIGKVLRHGLDSCHPDQPDRDNRADLCREMGDVRAAMILMCRAGIVEKQDVHAEADQKIDRVREYLHHAGRFADPERFPPPQSVDQPGEKHGS